MKKISGYITVVIFFLLIGRVNGFSQQLVQTVKDVPALEKNKDMFIGKPLSVLLNSIKPPIKRVSAIEGEGVLESRLYFYFMNRDEYDQYAKRTGKSPVRITVYVKEAAFDWNPMAKPKGHRFDWTENDKKKYGNLTVVNIMITGAQ